MNAFVTSSALPTGAATSALQGTNSATTAHTCSIVGYSILGCLGQLDDDIKSPIPAGTNNIGTFTIPATASTSTFQATNTATTTHTCSVAGYSELGCLGQIDDDVKSPIAAGTNQIGSIAGFAPGASFATLTVAGSSVSVALPTGVVDIFQNTGTTAVSCTLGVGSATAAASENVIQPGSWLALSAGSNTFGACIDQTGSTSNLVVISGGAGLPAGSGGGSGGGGGGGAVTIANGADITLGNNTDSASCGSGNSLIACDRQLHADLTSATPAGTNRTGFVTPQADTTGGCTWTHYYMQGASTNSNLVSTGAHTLCGFEVIQTGTTAGFLRWYDASAAPTCSSGTGVVAAYPVQSNATSPGMAPSLGFSGRAVTTGLGFCFTGAVGDTDATNFGGSTNAVVLNIGYK